MLSVHFKTLEMHIPPWLRFRYSHSSPAVATIREDVAEIVQILRSRTELQKEIERRCGYFIDLHEANLRCQYFTKADLIGANFAGADLSGAFFVDADLSNAQLFGAKFHNPTNVAIEMATIPIDEQFSEDETRGVLFRRALAAIFFGDANLSGTDFSGAGACPVEGLLQEHLDQAYANPKNPPKLEGVLDAKTGEQLVWRGNVKNS